MTARGDDAERIDEEEPRMSTAREAIRAAPW